MERPETAIEMSSEAKDQLTELREKLRIVKTVLEQVAMIPKGQGWSSSSSPTSHPFCPFFRPSTPLSRPLSTASIAKCSSSPPSGASLSRQRSLRCLREGTRPL